MLVHKFDLGGCAVNWIDEYNKLHKKEASHAYVFYSF